MLFLVWSMNWGADLHILWRLVTIQRSPAIFKMPFTYRLAVLSNEGCMCSLWSFWLQAVKYGGREEWEAVRDIAAKPKNPASGIAAMRAMGASRDSQLTKDAFDYIVNKARDQDMIYHFLGMSASPAARRYLIEAFKQHYDLVSTVSLQFIIRKLTDIIVRGKDCWQLQLQVSRGCEQSSDHIKADCWSCTVDNVL